jgi:NADPH-dependent glutamate synthase beta subunit-like oxidoreductase
VTGIGGSGGFAGPHNAGNVTSGTRGINRTVGVVDQAGLITREEIEELGAACTQEEPPACTAACPLHVDVRAVLAEAAAGAWAAASVNLRKTLPFPGILGRICTQPCRPVCKRGEAGDPIRIGALEQACADLGGPPQLPTSLPRRKRRVAVIGAGLTGATAAHDLVRRGYTVTLLDSADRLGAALRARAGSRLPDDVVDADLGVLAALGVQVLLGRAVADEDFERLCAEQDAVIVATGAGPDFGPDAGPDAGAAAAFGLPGTGGLVDVDARTGATGRDGVFAGGGACRGTAGSPVESMADGRRAAISVDRFLQRVSLASSREAEGRRTTCLFTRTEGVAAAAQTPMADPAAGYTAEEARAEAARCLQCSCLECVKVCAFLEHYGSYPKLYARRVLHNMMMVKGNHTANRLINSCSLCGLCADVCPTGVNVGGMLKRVRQRMVQQQQMPPSAHEFALRDLEFSNGEAFALARPLPGTQASRYAFFPGCQLAGSAPDHVRQVYGYLQDALGDVGLILRCCGATADWAGRTDLFEESLAEFDQQYQSLGRPTLILPCTSCFQVFAANRPDIPLRTLWSVLAEHGLPAAAVRAAPGATLAIHDPCTSRHDAAVQDDVRTVLTGLGYQVEELANSRERTECCSYGGLMWLANREIAEQTVRRRIEQSPRDFLTYCVMCRDLFAARGKRSLHLLDLLYGQDVDTRAARPNPGYTQRHENRARLKQGLLHSVWGEPMEEAGDGDPIRLRIDPQVRAAMEERLILDEDVLGVIAHVRRTGERLRDPRSGHWLARHRPRAVTYWVEYTEDGDEYVVHRAYSHRVQVLEGGHHAP